VSKTERTDLSRYTIVAFRKSSTAWRKKKKLDLLEMSSFERTNLIKEVRGRLRRKAREAKLWKSLLGLDNIVINGETVYAEESFRLIGLYLPN
jgi:hypothetical protein